ncbi:MAG: FtsX-like permease family protein [Bacteroidetes bacterium]|jgi:putative ABC transport system permease protein|nr:FtsX-like permease family protein [Bacteroidota bacterium]
MWTNYLRVALRSLRRQSLYSLINVLGLAVGLAFCILVLLFVRDELTYDETHERSDRTYRLYRDPVDGAPVDRELSMPIPAGPAMAATFPEVEAFVRLDFPGGATTIRHEGTLFEQDDVLATDSSFFDVFTVPLIHGDPATALTDPLSVVLTAPIARKYFGTANPVGQTLSLRLSGDYVDLTVTGVTEALPPNSSIQFAMLFPYDLFVERFDYMQRVRDRWDATRSITYVLLREGADVEHLRAQMPEFMRTHLGFMYDEMRQEGLLAEGEIPAIFRLQPMRDIHLNPEVPPGLTPPSDPKYSYILGGIALAVLLIACINFTLLALGRSARRAKEVGVRKAMGALRGQLMGQFWGEALLLSAVALGLGLGLAQIALPVFNDLAGKTLTLGAVEGLWMAAGLLGLLLVTGLVAGGYPALMLSRLQPAVTLRDRASVGRANALTRTLVTAQFALSVFLIASTLVMVQQLRHVRTTNLGFQGEQVVVIPTRGLDGDQVLDRYQALAANDPGIAQVAGSNLAIGQSLWRRGFQYEGELKQVAVFRITDNYLETLGMTVTQGRAFDPQRASDAANSILVNEAFVRDFGWTTPVGQQLPVEWGDAGDEEEPSLLNPTVVGVVEDFHFQSLHNAVQPAVLYTNPMDPILNLYVRLRPEDMSATLDRLRATWATLTQDVPFEYTFLDERMDRLYQNEARWSQIVGYGALFAVLIAVLGLFGMATLTTAQRTKEIGIRKVLGASAAQIVGLLSKDFARLVVLAIVLAAPVAYLVMERWLADFAVRIDVGVGTLGLAGGLALVVALLTVGAQAFRAAQTDPAHSLRYE